MILRSRVVLVAAGLMTLSVAAPMTAALAQQNNPTGNMGSNRSATASPGTADSKAASGMNTGDVGSRGTAANTYGGTATNTPTTSSTTPGGTGHAVVPGSTSSQASAASGTSEQKTGTMGAAGGGGAGK